MNVERLLSVLGTLSESAGRTRLVKQLNSITEALQAVVNEPNNPAHRQQLSERLTQLSQSTAEERLEKFSVVEREAIDEFVLEDVVGANVANRVQEIVRANAATMDIALKQVAAIRDAVSKDVEALRQIQSGLQHFGLTADSVEPNAAALSFLIPRHEESVEIPKLVGDLKDFDLISRAFELLVTGRQSPGKVASLASSDFAITLDTTIEIGLALALAVQWIIDRYQAVLTLRKTQVELKKLKAEDAAKSVDETASKRLEALANDVTAELIKRFNRKSAGADVENPLRKAVHKLAQKIDTHYRIEIRVSDPPPTDQSQEEPESDGEVPLIEKAREEIRLLNTSIKYFRASDDPIYLITSDTEKDE